MDKNRFSVIQSSYDSLCGKYMAMKRDYIKSIEGKEDEMLKLLLDSLIESHCLSPQHLSMTSTHSSSPIMNRGYYARL